MCDVPVDLACEAPGLHNSACFESGYQGMLYFWVGAGEEKGGLVFFVCAFYGMLELGYPGVVWLRSALYV